MSRFNIRTAVIAHDIIMTGLAWIVAWGARFNFNFIFPDWRISIYTIPTVLIVQGIIFWFFGIYRGLWRFASLPDLWNIIRASVLGAICITIVLFLMNRLEGIPRSIPVLYPVFLIFLLGGSRLTYRVWRDNPFLTNVVSVGKKALIIGAGRAGDMLVRDMLRNDNYTPIGFLDDNSKLKKSEIHGIPVLGAIDKLPEIIGRTNIDIIIIALPSATNKQMQRIVEICKNIDIPIYTLPSISNLRGKNLAETQLYQLSIDDVLGRDKVELDRSLLEKGIANKTILVTGGGGSIGSELCQQIANLKPTNLIIFEKSEFGLYKIHQKLTKKFSQLNLNTILGDIQDENKVRYVFDKYKPDVVFHTAAYKHVPILEEEVREAVLNNVIGTKILTEAADHYRCEKFVLISTDKAVNPTNILGKSKRVAEIFCEGINHHSATQYITVRFGNVLDSDGSVVPLFREQIANGGPVTVTHPDITRYFMTIEEACQLILQAGAMGNGGEIFVLDMGNPVKITYLAEQMIRLSGFIPGENIDIKYIGLRPGEKLHEELFYKDEKQENTDHKKILLANQNKVSWSEVIDNIELLVQACSSFDNSVLTQVLDRLTISYAHKNQVISNLVEMPQRLK